MIDYGSRIRAVANYLETVPGDKYDFYIGPGRAKHLRDGCGCAMTHGLLGEVIASDANYDAAIEWTFGFSQAASFHELVSGEALLAGETAKRAMIAQLRAYADATYPVANPTPKHTGIPACVREIFEAEAA